VHVLPFLAVSAVVVLTPGVDMATYAELAARGRNMLGRPRVKRALDRLTGVALVGLGVRLAFER
jgi:threonine/homoserine/homoserine lactone efflux protein